MFGLYYIYIYIFFFFKGVPDPGILSTPSFSSATSNSNEVAVEGRSKVLYCLATAR